MYTIDTNNSEIDWNAKGIKKKLQNINNLLCTIKGEIPYRRGMGRDIGNLDSSLNKTRYKLIEETYDIINNYAPDTIIKSVDISFDKNYEPIIKVVVDFE